MLVTEHVAPFIKVRIQQIKDWTLLFQVSVTPEQIREMFISILSCNRCYKMEKTNKPMPFICIDTSLFGVCA